MTNVKDETVTLLATGDNIPSRDDYDSLYQHVAPLLRAADVSFGQVETVLIDKAIDDLYPYVASQARMPCSSDPDVAPAMKRNGFDIVSFASNHALDYGRTHFLNTIRYLRDAGLEVIGVGENEEDARRFSVIERKGVKIAFLGYCTILPQDYWAQEARPGMNPARGHTYYEQIEHDQPGTPCRIHSFAHKGDKAKMLEDIKKRKNWRTSWWSPCTGASTSPRRRWRNTSLNTPMTPSTPAPISFWATTPTSSSPSRSTRARSSSIPWATSPWRIPTTWPAT